MKKVIRNITTAVLVLALLSGMMVFSACNGEEDGDRVTVRVGWTPPDVTGVFATVTQFMEYAVEDAAAHGIDVVIIERPPVDHMGVAEQIGIIEFFILQNVDVIVVSPTDVDGIIPALQQVNDAGIPLIMVNMMSEIPGVDVTSFVGFDNRVAASVTGWSMVNALGGPGPLPQAADGALDVDPATPLNLGWWEALYEGFDKESIYGQVAIIEGITGDYFANARNQGFLDVIDQFPNIEILGILPGNWNRAVSIDAAEAFLTAHGPGEIDAIFAPSSEMGFGARLATEAQGREEVLVLTHGGTAESGDWIRAGRLLVDTWHGFPDWGWYSIKFAVMLTLGQEVPYMFDIGSRTQWYGNAHMFFPDVQLSPIDWQEILDNAR